MKTGFISVLIGSVLLTGALIFAITWKPATSERSETLQVYCAAGIREPMAAAMAAYQQQYHTDFQVGYAGSGALLSDIRAGGGDIYLAADDAYIQEARKLGLARESFNLASQHPVLVVRKGNPKQIQGISDLTRGDVKLSLAEPKVAAVSKVAKQLLGDQWEPVWKSIEVSRDTVNAVANDVKAEFVDAGIVWDATAASYPELEIVPVSAFEASPNFISVAALTDATGARRRRALHFLRYLASKDGGLKYFAAHHFNVVPADKWSERPELEFMAGGVNRPVVEPVVKQFQDDWGCEVNTTYNGCGILVGSMKAGARPDLYYACDVTFMTPVRDPQGLNLFDMPIHFSKTDIVIVTEKGNPKNLKSLADLAGEGVKLALCDPQKSTLGELTDELLRRAELLKEVRANQIFSTSTADQCVQAVVAGRLDAAVVYRANTVTQTDKLEILMIDDPKAFAVQPIAVATNSQNKRLATLLRDAIVADENRRRLADLGFEVAE